jgi:hypothetical protein
MYGMNFCMLILYRHDRFGVLSLEVVYLTVLLSFVGFDFFFGKIVTMYVCVCVYTHTHTDVKYL